MITIFWYWKASTGVFVHRIFSHLVSMVDLTHPLTVTLVNGFCLSIAYIVHPGHPYIESLLTL